MITVLAPAYYPTLEPVRYLVKSAARYNIPVTFYGTGRPYKGWFDIQITELLSLIRTITTKYILYTDASDAFFCGGLIEIMGKYIFKNEPGILISRERSGVCAGGWLAQKEAILPALYLLQAGKPECEDPDNPQVRWRKALEWGLVTATEDVDSDIFQVVDEPLQVQHGRIFNPRTGRYPNVIHFAGGYTDPVVGKAELIEPYWRQLGYA